MPWKGLLPLVGPPICAVLAASSAAAACSDRDRPPAPEAVQGEAIDAQAIRVSFRSNSLWWDVNVRESSGKPVESRAGVSPSGFVDGTHKRAYFQFVRLKPDTNYCVQIFARTQGGTEGCTSKTPASVCAQTLSDPKSSSACNAYAKTAVDTVNLARNVYKCDPKLITGPRWSSSEDEHRTWCMQVPPASRKAETDARTTTLHRCRVAKRVATPTLSVTWQAGNVFKVVGRNFLPNTPIAIDVSGPPTTPHTITVASGSRIVSNAIGNFALTLSDVCTSALNRGAVAFTARDQDGNQAKATANCQGSVNYTPKRKIKP